MHFKFVYVATRCCSSLVCFLFLVKTEGEFLLHFKVFCCGRSTHHADCSGKEREREKMMYVFAACVKSKQSYMQKCLFFFPSSFLGLGILDLDSPSLAIPISPVLPTTHKASKALAMEQLTWCYYNHGIPHPANQIYRNKLEREIIKSKAID